MELDRDLELRWNSANVSQISLKFINQTLILESPDPGIYELKSDFDIGKPSTANTAKGGSKRGIYTFGIGRQHYNKVHLPEDHHYAADFTM